MNPTFKVGLETHLHLNTVKKLYCNCLVDQETCARCTARPGHFPQRINPQAIEKAVILSRVLRGTLNPLVMCRKHYFYYDLLASYQLTQDPARPFATKAHLKTLEDQIIPIEKLLLEEDPAATVGKSIDCTRSGACLIEVVTEPVFEGSLDEVVGKIGRYLRTLAVLALELNLVHKNKIMKTDVNVSLKGKDFRYEIKNLDSLTRIKKALYAAKDLLLDPNCEPLTATYDYKNSLKKSRIKQTYLYLAEPNLPTYDTETYASDLKPHQTLYALRDKVGPYVTQENVKNKDLKYLFLKKLAFVSKVHDLSEKEIDEILEHPFEKALYTLKNYELLKNEKIITQALKKVLAETGCSQQDFKQKNLIFIKSITKLKQQLLSLDVRFNSEIILKQFENLYK